MQQLNIFKISKEESAERLRETIEKELIEYNIKENFNNGTLRELQEYLNKQKNYKEYYEKLIETLLKHFPLIEDLFNAEETGIWNSGKGLFRYVVPKKQSGPIYSLAFIPNIFFTKGVD